MQQKIKRASKHNYKSRTWIAWYGMWRRVDRKSRPSAKPCTADPRWRDYSVFLHEMGECPRGKSLDKDIRYFGNRHYDKDKCMWATRLQQARARDCTTWVTIDGKRVALTQALSKRKAAVGVDTIRWRLKAGYSFDDACKAKPFSHVGKKAIGMVSGKLTVTKDLGTIWVCKSYARQVDCTCECGGKKVCLLRSIQSKLVKSCGCLRRKNIKLISEIKTNDQKQSTNSGGAAK